LIRESDASNVVSARVHIKTGSINEGEYLTAGLSHYLEHVVSGGTTSRRTEQEIKDLVQSIGGVSNAFTSYDSTVYFIETTGPHANIAVDTLLDYVFNPKFDEGEVNREKGVIIREILMGENDPDRKFWKFFTETAYQQSPVRYPIIGYKTSFEKVTRDQLMNYYHQRYAPDNAIMCVVGNVDALAILKQIIHQAGDLQKGLKSFPLPVEPVQVSPRFVEMVSPLAKITRVEVGFPSITLTDPDLYALDVLAMILGQGRTSRLYKALKDDNKLALSVSASSWTPDFVRGLFNISLSLDYNDLDKALETMWGEIERLKADGPTLEELNRAQKKTQADYIFSQQSVSAMSGELASSYASTGDPYFNRDYTARIQQVGVDEIKAVARKYLQKQQVTVATLKPADVKAGSTAGLAGPERAEDGAIHKTTLENGLTVLTKVNRTSPTVSIQLYGPGGLRYEPADQPGISLFAASLLTRGSKGYTKQELAEAVEDMGANINGGSGQNSLYVSMSLLSSDLAKGLSIFGDVVKHPTFPQDEIEKQRQDTLQVIKTLDESWSQELMRLYRKTHFTNHPFRNDIVGTAESVKSFTHDGLDGFYHSLLKPNHMTLAVFGDIDPQETLALIKAEFGELKQGDLPPDRSVPQEYVIEENSETTKPNEKTSAGILMAFNGVSITSPERPVEDVLDALVSGIGYPGGWLHEALRGGESNLVYVVHAFPSYAPDGGNFLVIAQSFPQNLGKVKEIITSQFKRLLSEPINAEELERAKQSVVISHEMGLETNAEQASSAALDEQMGLGYDYSRDYVKAIQKVTADDIRKLAEKSFQSALIVETVPEMAARSN